MKTVSLQAIQYRLEKIATIEELGSDDEMTATEISRIENISTCLLVDSEQSESENEK